MEAMDKIGAAKDGFRPDKVIAYAFGDPKLDGTTFKTKGAVFRSKGEWYKLKYKCSTGPDHIQILSFNYKIGDLIPHDEWDAHYLYP